MGGYKNGQDTFQESYEESAMPFAPSQEFGDPNPGASWGSTGEAAFAATAMDCVLEADGHTVSTWAKAGPSNQSGASPAPPAP